MMIVFGYLVSAIVKSKDERIEKDLTNLEDFVMVVKSAVSKLSKLKSI